MSVRVLADLADQERWTGWLNEPRADDPAKTTKVPYCAPGRKSQSNNPKTWITRATADRVARAIVNGAGGGVGIWLGDLGDGTTLIGIDLDTCRDPASGIFAPWGLEIIERVNSYAEISPSATGSKIYALIGTEALAEVRAQTGIKHGKSFSRRNGTEHPPAIELHVSNRYFAVTDQHITGAPDELAILTPDILIWLLTKRGPDFAGGGEGKGRGTGGDRSRSAAAFRIGVAMRREGNTLEEFSEAVRTNPETAEWWREKGIANNSRELRRIWERAALPPPPGERPVVQVIAGQLPRVVDEAEGILIESDDDLYAFGDQVVRPALAPIRIADDQQTVGLRLVPVKLHHMIERFTRSVDFRQFNKKEKAWLPIDCPEAVAKVYLERIGLWRLRRLTAIAACPLLLADGRVIDNPGFDDASGILFDPQGMVFPPMPERPSRDDAALALADLRSLFREIPFVDDRARSVMLSALLTSVSRLAYDFAPLHGFDAPVAGTGKSKLVNACSVLANGHECPVISQGDDKTEFEKRLGAELIEGNRIISIDNCEAPLGGELLCQTMTQTFLKVRVLGLSKSVLIANTALMFATGNNLRFYGDMLRRGLICHLDAGEERPELRAFEQEDPVTVLKRERGYFVTAALTVLRAYIVAGKPVIRQPLGGYEGWSDLVRNALLWLDQTDPVDTIDSARADDPDRQHLEAVVTQWHAVFEGSAVTARAVIDEARRTTIDPAGNVNHLVFVHPEFRNALLDVAGERDEISPRRLGTWLGKHRHNPIGGFRLAPAPVLRGAGRWRVEQRGDDGRWR
jgi:hypothetical protein